MITGGRFGLILEPRDVFLAPEMWFSRFQNSFYVAIIAISYTASFTATQKYRHGFDTETQLNSYTEKQTWLQRQTDTWF